MISAYLLFEITPKCDFDCIYCYNIWKEKTKYQQRTLSAENIVKLFDKISNQTNIEGVTITGGEPLLYPDLARVIEFFNSKKIEVGLTTHGALLDEDKAKLLIDKGVSYFEISLDSLKSDVFKKMTGRNQLKNVKKAILNVKKYNALLTISTIITKLNLNEIPDIIDLSFAFSADFISLNRFIPGGKGLMHKNDLMPEKNELEKVLEIANNKAEKYKFDVNISVPIEDCLISHKKYPFLNFGTCLCGRKKWLIDSIGNLRTCEQNPDIFGNLFYESFPDLYFSEKAENFRNNNLKKNCPQCSMFCACGGGCRFLR